MTFNCVLITVEDIARSRNFYENVLHQKVKYDFGENIVFHGDFAIHKKEHFQKLIINKPIADFSHSFELYFEDDELKSLQETLKSLSISFIHEIQEQPWRQQVMRFYDPDGNIIEVGESMPHLCKRLFLEGSTLEQIIAITQFPKEFIENSIA